MRRAPTSVGKSVITLGLQGENSSFSRYINLRASSTGLPATVNHARKDQVQHGPRLKVCSIPGDRAPKNAGIFV
jgi:hypothetical protein